MDENEKGRKYKWKGCAPEETLEVSRFSTKTVSLRLASSIRPPKFHAQNHGTGTIAHFQPQEDGRSKLAQIHVNPQAQEILDTVIFSFLFLEKGKRALESPAFAHDSKIRTGQREIVYEQRFPLICGRNRPSVLGSGVRRSLMKLLSG